MPIALAALAAAVLWLWRRQRLLAARLGRLEDRAIDWRLQSVRRQEELDERVRGLEPRGSRPPEPAAAPGNLIQIRPLAGKKEHGT